MNNLPIPKDELLAGKYMLTGYAVAFIDLLGVSTSLRALHRARDQDSDGDTLRRALSEALGPIERFQEAQRIFYGIVADNDRPEYRIGDLNPEQASLARALLRKSPEAKHFSDCISISIPLTLGQSTNPASDLYDLLLFCSMLLPYMLSMSSPVRGAIAIGYGSRLSGSADIVSSAQERAYRLETELAGYPRIVIDSELHEYLRENSRVAGDDPSSRFTRHQAEKCLELVHCDLDGELCVHYLGQHAYSALTRFEDDIGASMFRMSWAFAQAELERFLRSGNVKLARRYDALVRYYSMFAPEPLRQPEGFADHMPISWKRQLTRLRVALGRYSVPIRWKCR